MSPQQEKNIIQYSSRLASKLQDMTEREELNVSGAEFASLIKDIDDQIKLLKKTELDKASKYREELKNLKHIILEEKNFN